jgi:uncharacterized protein YndB with AHSA1/START domain
MPSAARKSDESQSFASRADIVVDASPEDVWAILTSSEKFGEVMFGSTITTDWKVGGPITYSGQWQGKPFEDKGRILELDRPKTFRSTHVAGSDTSHTEHEVAFTLEPEGGGTRVRVSQDNNPSQEAADKSAKNWEMTLKNLKKVAEG